MTWDHVTRGEDGAFLLYVLPTVWKGLLVMVSKGTNSGGDKAGRSMGKSQLERQKKAEEPSLLGSQAHQRREEEEGAVGPTPVLPKVHSLGMNVCGEEREARAKQSVKHMGF